MAGRRTLKGKETIRKTLAARFAVIPDMRWDHKEYIFAGNRAISVWTVKGKGVSFMENAVLWHYRTARGAYVAASEVSRYEAKDFQGVALGEIAAAASCGVPLPGSPAAVLRGTVFDGAGVPLPARKYSALRSALPKFCDGWMRCTRSMATIGIARA